MKKVVFTGYKSFERVIIKMESKDAFTDLKFTLKRKLTKSSQCKEIGYFEVVRGIYDTRTTMFFSLDDIKFSEYDRTFKLRFELKNLFIPHNKIFSTTEMILECTHDFTFCLRENMMDLKYHDEKWVAEYFYCVKNQSKNLVKYLCRRFCNEGLNASMYILEIIKGLRPELKTYSMCLYLLKRYEKCILFVPKNIIDRKMSMIVVRKDERLVKYIPDEFHMDCVKKNIYCLRELTQTLELCRVAFEKDREVYEIMDYQFKHHFENEYRAYMKEEYSEDV